MYHADPQSNREMQGELYDMLEDKNELNNLWGVSWAFWDGMRPG